LVLFQSGLWILLEIFLALLALSPFKLVRSSDSSLQ
jgi:hypothetical protein